MRHLRLLPPVLLAACTCGAPTAPEATVVRVVPEIATEDLNDPSRPLDPASLFPALLPTGPFGAAPTALVVDLARPVWNDLSDATASGTVIRLDPPVDGTLEWTKTTQLRFTPTAALPPGTQVTATLSKLDTRDGVLDVPGTTTFRVPDFGLGDVSLSEHRPADDAQRLDLSFSGPVDEDSVLAALTVRVDDGRTLRVSSLGQPEPHVVRVEVSGVPAGATALGVSLTDGATSAVAPVKAAAAERSVELTPAGKAELHLFAAIAREGGSSLVIDVVCDDDAVDGWERYWWDESASESYWVSPRCDLDADTLARRIHVDPPVPITVVPSGPGFRLRGDFTRGAYTLRVDAGARTVDGGVLRKPLVASLVVPARSPSLRFTSKGRYLPRNAWGALPVEHRNAPEAQVTLRHVPRRNLVFWMTGESESADVRTSELVADARIALRTELDKPLTTWVDLADLVPTPAPGVWEVTVAAPGTTDVSRVLVTDMQLLAKAGTPRDGVTPYDVWAVDVHSTRPLSEVSVELVRASGQVVDRCTTDAAGHCTVDTPADVDKSPAVALIATRGEDMTYLAFADLRLDNAEQDVKGEPWVAPSPWRAATWTERGVYRPGETVHVAALLRDAEQRPPAAEMPVHVEVIDPRGRTWKRVAVTPDTSGLAALDVTLGDFATTGRYEVRVRVGDETIGHTSFNAEEFVPERMSVSASVVGGDRRLGDPVQVEVKARYLFGGSAAGSPVELDCRLLPTAFTPPQGRDLAFGSAGLDPSSATAGSDLGRVSGVLDDDGTTTLTCPDPSASTRVGGTTRLVADVAVFEGGSGRASRTTTEATLHPAAFYVGLVRPTGRAAAGRAVTVTGQLVDWTGAPVKDGPTEVTVETLLVESEWDWTWDDEFGGESLRRWRRATPDGESTASVSGGRFSLTVTPSSDAEAVLVRVKAGDAVSEVAVDMEGWHGWWDGGGADDRTPRPLAPQQLSVTVPAEVRVGEPVSATFTAPFAGRALVTVETDRVVHSAWLDVTEGPNTWPFELSDFTPTAYVGVLLLSDPHALSADAWIPERAWGVAAVRVTPSTWALPVTVDAPAEARPGEPLVIDVDLGTAAAGASVIVAAVDEGVLQLTKHATPDPLALLFPRRALGVDTFETVGWGIARPPGGPSSATGGDAASLAGRVSMVKPVALWSGVLTADAKGRVKASFDLPHWRGKLRVMVAAATAQKSGSAEASVLVKDPLVVQATLPRFLLAGDQAELPVFVTNTTDAVQTVQVKLASEPLPLGGFASPALPVSITGGDTTQLTLEPGASGTTVFRVGANTVGAARLTVTATAGKLVSKESLDLPVGAPSPEVHRTVLVPLSAGETSLASHLTGWTPTTERTRVWITANRYAHALDSLSGLLQYPHGCVEQTSSQLRPLLYLSDLAPSLVPDLKGRADVDAKVRAGLDRVLSMQTASGGFGYWPGDTDPGTWATAYATEVLLDASERGHAVPKEALADAGAWLAAHVDDPHRWATRDAYVRAYPHWVLARLGKLDKARATRDLGSIDGDTAPRAVEARYLLQAALYLAGDRRHEAALKKPDASKLTTLRTHDGTWWSDLRARGVILAVHTQLFGADDAGAEPLASRVADGISAHGAVWYTTQELAWGLTGLGKRAGKAATGATVTVRDGGTTLSSDTTAAGQDAAYLVPRASERTGLVVDAKLPQGGQLFAVLSSTGVRSDSPARVGGSGLSVTRSLLTADGAPFVGTAMRLGTLAYSVTTITNRSKETLHDLSLTDRLPAGWEVESARLRDDGTLPVDPETLWEVDHLDVRDDRVVAFGALRPGESKVILVAVRAVTAGTFTLPGAEAEAMYDPTIWARSPSVSARVLGDWEAFWL